MTERDDSLLAAEYVLGVLTPEAAEGARRRARGDAAFASHVEYWRARFLAFDATAEEIMPDPDLWRRIEQDLDRPDVAEPVSARGFPGWFWNSVGALRAAVLASVITSLACAGLAFAALRHAQDMEARRPVFVAILVDDATKQAGAVVNAFGDGRVEMVPLTDIAVPDDRVLEIWTLWDRAVGPRSVGKISRAQTTRLNLTGLPATHANQLFEITLEPAGGSPIGRPTGPILFKGTTARAL